jgi:transposase
MLNLLTGRIFVVLGATDMRKSFDTLSGVVRDRLGAEPTDRDTFVFCNQHRTRLRILVYDESGVWVLAKRLDRGTFSWPTAERGEHGVEYRVEQLILLLRGFDADELRPRRWRRHSSEEAPTSKRSVEPIGVAMR